jgi:branched-chain amino acid transport system substrate-binding protein
MNHSSKWIVGIILVVTVAAIGYFVSKSPKGSSLTSIKIGVVAPMTGDLAFMGEGIRDAILLAKENLGDVRYTYDIIFEDDQLKPQMSASAVNKLISVDKADVIVSFGSGTGNVIAPVAEKNKVAHFGIASDPNVAKGRYNFIHWTPPAEENKVFVEELQRRGLKKLGVFESNQQGAAAAVADLHEKLKGTDIEIVTDQVFNPGEKDFRSIIAKAKNSGADIYLLMAFSPELEVLGKQIKEAGINTPLTSIESFELSEQVALFEGDWYVNAADPTTDFTDKFKAKTGKSPTLGAANAYDIFNLVAVAAEKIKGSTKPTRDQIVDELIMIKGFSGVLGNLSVNEDGIVISKAAVRIIKDGKPFTLGN